jgi:hypothetical protein
MQHNEAQLPRNPRPSRRQALTSLAAASLGAVTLAVVERHSPAEAGQMMSDPLDEVLQTWPELPRQAAQQLIGQYGPPAEVTASSLTWGPAGPWKRTILYRDEVPHHFPKPHTDFLEQVIDYRVPPEKYDELAAYDGSVIVERTTGELSARCDKEGLNFLALNLANEIVTDRLGVGEARRAYGENAMKFLRGEVTPFTAGLQFMVAMGGTADPDEPLM